MARVRRGTQSAFNALTGSDRLAEGDFYVIRETGETYVGTSNPDAPIKQSDLDFTVRYQLYSGNFLNNPAHFSDDGSYGDASGIGGYDGILSENGYSPGTFRRFYIRAVIHDSDGITRPFSSDLSYAPGDYELATAGYGYGNKSAADWLNTMLTPRGVRAFPIAFGRSDDVIPMCGFSFGGTLDNPFILETQCGYNTVGDVVSWDIFGRGLLHFGLAYPNSDSIRIHDQVGHAIGSFGDHIDPNVPAFNGGGNSRATLI